MLNCPVCHQSLFIANRSCPDHGGSEVRPTPSPDHDDCALGTAVPQFGTFDELTNSRPKIRWKKKYKIACGLVLALFVGREIGLIDLSLVHFDITSKTETELDGHLQVQTSESVTSSQISKTIGSSTASTGSYYGLGFHSFTDNQWTIDVKKEVQDRVGKQTKLTAVVEEFTLSGVYWLPIIKTGTCTYRVRLEFLGKDSVGYSGVLNGTTGFQFYAVCSVRTLKQKLSEVIASDVVKSVDGLTRK